MISICGLNCEECGAFIATRDDDDLIRIDTAKEWSKLYQKDIKPGDIHCLGCHTKSEDVFSYPKICEIRKCGFKREIENCAHCDEYICEKLDDFFQIAGEAKINLEMIRKTL